MFALRATIIIQQWNRAQINRPEFTSSPLHHPLFSAKHLPRPKHLRLHLLHLIQRFYRPTFPSCDYFFFLLARACNPALFPDLICPLPRPSILLLSLSLSPSRTRVEHRHKEKKERENPRISSGDLSPRTLSRGRISPKRWYEFSGSRALLSFLSLSLPQNPIVSASWNNPSARVQNFRKKFRNFRECAVRSAYRSVRVVTRDATEFQRN